MTASRNSWRSWLRTSRSPTIGSRASTSSPSMEPPRGNTPSSTPSRHTTRCGTDRIGVIVQTVSVPVRKLARVGRPASRESSIARTSGSRSSIGVRAVGGAGQRGQLAMQLGDLPLLAARDVGQLHDALAEHLEPVVDRVGPGQLPGQCLEPVDRLGEPAGQGDVDRGDVVQGQRRAEPEVGVVGEGDAREDAVEPEAPGVLLEGGQAVLLASGPVPRPADAATG